MKQKKLLALGLVGVMAISSSLLAVAGASESNALGTDTNADTTDVINGSGGLEGYVDKDVFLVTLPATETINFNLDPQGLIRQTAADDAPLKIDGTTVSKTDDTKDNLVLFEGENYATDKMDYRSKSAPITIVNKGTVDVKVGLKLEVSGLTADGKDYKINLVDTSDPAKYKMADSKKTDIELKLTPSTGTTTNGTVTVTADTTKAKVLTDAAGGVSVSDTITTTDAAKTAYKVVKEADHKYKYSLDATKAATTAFNTISYNLSGIVNTKADWEDFYDATGAVGNKLSVKITYDIKGGSASFLNRTSVDTTNNKIIVDFEGTSTGASNGIASLVITKSDNSTVTWARNSQYSVRQIDATKRELTISPSTLTNHGCTVTVTLTGGEVATFTIE